MGTVLTSFFSAGERAIEETETTNGIEKKKEYAYWNGGIDDVIAVIQDGQTYFFHKDWQGSLMAVTDGTGNLVEKYRYDAYGATYVQSGSLFVPLSDSVKPFATRLYTGREYDAETGLYHYRARTYSPSLGRFLQRDPVDTGDQVNLYAYVGNNPVNRTDPSGKFFLAANLIGWAVSVGLGMGVEYLSSKISWEEYNYSMADAAVDFWAGFIWAGILNKTAKMGMLGKVLWNLSWNVALWVTGAALKSNCPKSQFTMQAVGENMVQYAIASAIGKAGGKLFDRIIVKKVLEKGVKSIDMAHIELRHLFWSKAVDDWSKFIEGINIKKIIQEGFSNENRRVIGTVSKDKVTGKQINSIMIESDMGRQIWTDRNYKKSHNILRILMDLENNVLSAYPTNKFSIK